MKLPDKMLVIENIYPEIDDGRFPIKREIGENLEVFADVYKEGHDPVVPFLKYRHYKDKTWRKVAMTLITDHRWKATFQLQKLGRYEYTIEVFPKEKKELVSQYDRILEVVVDDLNARFSAWYEMFPRSQGTDPTKSATFDDMIKRLPEIRAMGFDVVYLTPIHPIGRTNRKGPNNSLICGPDDPGCPYAIGNESGGHKAVEPGLGTMDDFRRFVNASAENGMQTALDIAFSIAPDHPYVKEHPEWFSWNEDGSVKFAENPPKKYEDICHINFYPENWQEMWDELTSVFLFWADEGVKIFRVDNPHTKPVYFWEYCIKKVKDKYPEVLFFSEAFTHPKMMKYLAKAGYSMSYTYFTWRNTKWELTTYLRELTQTEMSEYFRPNFFANTPDILPFFLQKGGRNAFKIRLVLAATLAGVYGIYNGFELCENTGIPGKEEYINSEKYQYKVWDWDRPGNIKLFIKAINRIRNENPALQYFKNLQFVETDNEQILAYYKTSPDLSNIILVVVNLDPYNTQESTIHIPHTQWNIASHENYTVIDLLSGQTFIWKGGKNYVKLNPHAEPVHIFKVSKWKHYERDFSLI